MLLPCVALAFAFAGCAADQAHTGGIDASLTLDADAVVKHITTATVTIQCAGIDPITGLPWPSETFDVNLDTSEGNDPTDPKDSLGVFKKEGLPEGLCTVTITAVSDDGTMNCGGQMVDIPVIAGPDNTFVTIIINCITDARYGGIGVEGEFNQCAEYSQIVVSPTTQSTGGDPVDVQVWCYDPDGGIDSPLAAILFITAASSVDPNPANWVNCGTNTDFQYPPVPQACPHQDPPTVIGAESLDLDLNCSIGDDPGPGDPGTPCVVIVSISDDGFAAGGTDPFGCDGTDDNANAVIPVFCQSLAVCGNSVIEFPEQCDPPGAPNGDGDFCDAQCKLIQQPVEGPIPGAIWVGDTRNIDYNDVGFVQEEFFLAGTATSYINSNTLQSDGLWDVVEADTAVYKTRIVVYRPQDPVDFSGTVVVEWFNVSGGLDAAPDWSSMHTEAFREGHVWVGVSAQFVGVEGGGGGFDLSLKTVDPVRYGSLSHPGDSFSYDMFTQAAEAVRNPVGIDPLPPGFNVQRMIGVGESQSAARLLTYVNALAKGNTLFDAYLIHSRLGGSAPLSQSPEAQINTPAVVNVRDDLSAPVLMAQTESDLILLGSLADRQADSAGFRLWEIAGTAHNDVYGLLTSNSDLGNDPSVADVVEVTEPVPGIITCNEPINSGPQHWVLKAGLHGLIDWVDTGIPMPTANRLQVSGGAFDLDALGNALGGIRTPYLDVPVAVLSGLGQTGGGFCAIFGTTSLFDTATLQSLYIDNADYVSQVTASTNAAVAAGFILPPDAALIITAAQLSTIPN
jgi:hypothetical protein